MGARFSRPAIAAVLLLGVTTAVAYSIQPTKQPPITALLTTCKTACVEITPFVSAVYDTLNKDPNTAVLKADKSYFSLADGVVQASRIFSLHFLHTPIFVHITYRRTRLLPFRRTMLSV